MLRELFENAGIPESNIEALLRREASRALARYALEDGRVEFASPAHIISARKR